MPDDRLARARTTLPPGFQFGDGKRVPPPQHDATCVCRLCRLVAALEQIDPFVDVPVTALDVIF